MWPLVTILNSQFLFTMLTRHDSDSKTEKLESRGGKTVAQPLPFSHLLQSCFPFPYSLLPKMKAAREHVGHVSAFLLLLLHGSSQKAGREGRKEIRGEGKTERISAAVSFYNFYY